VSLAESAAILQGGRHGIRSAGVSQRN
jgi:hypothetical protein